MATVSFERGDYFLIDKERSVVVRHSGLRCEGGLFEVNVFYDPNAHISDCGIPSLSRKAISLFQLNIRARKQVYDQSLILEISDTRKELDVAALRRHLNINDRQEALSYRGSIISSQADLKAWDDELGPIGSLRSLKPIQQFIFVLKVENTANGLAGSEMIEDLNVVQTRSVRL